METFCKDSWKKNKKKVEGVSEEDDYDDSTSTDNDHPLTDKVSTNESYPLKGKSSVSKEILQQLEKKHGPVSKNFTKGESSSTKPTEKSVNICHLSNK